MSVDRPDPRIVGLEGPATIYEVSALREILREELAAGNDFRIDLGDTGKWDLAGLQLLISCIRTGQSRGQAIRLFRIPKICEEIAERSGLADWLRDASE
jgi:ABC-type transporter Mla MlaB component